MFQSLPDIEQKVFFLLSKKLQQCCQNCILRVYRNSLNEVFSWKKVFSFFYIIRTLSEKILAFYQFFFEGVVKSVFYMSMGTFRRKIFSIILFTLSILFRTLTGRKFGFHSSFFRQGWKNFILSLKRYNLRKAFRQKNYSLSLLGNEQKHSGCKNSILRVPMNILMNFSEKNVFFRIFIYCANFFSFLSKYF